MATGMPTATIEATVSVAKAPPQAQMMLKPTPGPTERMLDQQALPTAKNPAQADRVEAAPAIDPLRISEITLLALVVVLGIATLVARRKQA
jgi:hypothetical protein